MILRHPVRQRIKKNLPHIRDVLGSTFDGGVLCEPFFGYATLSLEILNEQFSSKATGFLLSTPDKPICDLWNAVLCSPELLCSRIEDTVPSVELYAAHHSRIWNREPRDLSLECLTTNWLADDGIGVRDSPLGGAKQNRKYPVGWYWNPEELIDKVQSLHKTLTGLNLFGNQIHHMPAHEAINPDYYQLIVPPEVRGGKDWYREFYTWGQHIKLKGVLDGCPRWLLICDCARNAKRLYKTYNILVDGRKHYKEYVIGESLVIWRSP